MEFLFSLPNECVGLNAYAARNESQELQIAETVKGVIVKLKEYECVQVSHHRDVGKVIEEWQKKGWRLHTYQATEYRMDVNHYLLFEKGE